MANPQPDKYFKMSNEFYDAICMLNLNSDAMQILNAIIRKTWGFNKKSDVISTIQFMELTGLERRAVERARAKLIKRRLIIVSKDIKYSILKYSIQKNYELWLSTDKNDGTQFIWSTDKNGSKVPTFLVQSTDNPQAKVPTKMTVHINTKDTKDTKDNKDSKFIQQILRNIDIEIKDFRKIGMSDTWIKSKYINMGIPEVNIDCAMGKQF